MKFSLAALLLVVAGTAVAADSVTAGLTRPGPPPLERFVKPLALSADQQARLRPLFAEAQAQAARDVRDAAADGKQVAPAELTAQQKMREADFRTRLASVLSPEQLAGYERLVADAAPRERTGEMNNGHGHRDADNAATASDRPDTSAKRPSTPPAR